MYVCYEYGYFIYICKYLHIHMNSCIHKTHIYLPYTYTCTLFYMCIQGSVLIWDQRILHGTQPNQSERCRCAH
ncbi:hypothetical protein EON63_15645 [archaeon]|nr:MAG: hypothetical protein EON63_15645 [archaeon]